MPLPVERSQGSVSALVARFQTAANRDANSQRRQSLVPVARRSSSHNAPRPSATIPSPSSPSGADEKSREDPKPMEHDELGSHGTGVGIKNKVGDVVQSVKGLVVGGGASAQTVNEHMARDEPLPAIERKDQPSPSSPAVEDTTAKGPIDGTSDRSPPGEVAGTQTRSAGKGPMAGKMAPEVISAPAPRMTRPSLSPTSTTRTANKPSPGQSAGKPKTTASLATSPTISTSPRSCVPTVPPKSNIISPAGNGTPMHRKQSSSSSNKTSSATSPSTIKSPPASLSKASSSLVSRVVPSHTGPARRESSTSSPGPSPAPTPLRPQMTGLPAKPTASSLAKARTPSGSMPLPSEKRQSLSLGKTSGPAARARLGPPSPGPTVASAAPPAKLPAQRGLPSSSSSRLLQGTAASRAKTAELHATASSSASHKATSSKIMSTKPTRSRLMPASQSNGSVRETGSSKIITTAKVPAGERPVSAVAGTGRGGKVGKEYNEERNAEIKAGKIKPLDGARGHVPVGQKESDGKTDQARSNETHQNDGDHDPTDAPIGPSNGPDTAHVHHDNVKAELAGLDETTAGGPDLASSSYATNDAIDEKPCKESLLIQPVELLERPNGDKGHARETSAGSLEEIPDIG